MEEQVLDSMDIERERGITIKAQTAALEYKSRSGQIYNLNLIDTPGHVDFSYEVSRSLSACEGALLVVDASQGVEGADGRQLLYGDRSGCRGAASRTRSIFLRPCRIMHGRRSRTSSGLMLRKPFSLLPKTGLGVEDILESIIERIPAPQGDPEAPLKYF